MEPQALGAFYTPPDLAAQVAAAALPVVGSGAVLDPACGDGSLLVAAAARLSALGVPRGRIAARLVGIDRNPEALAAARERLAGLGGSVRLVCADFLRDEISLPRVGAVLANPPYLSVKRAHLGERGGLRARFDLARGQYDAHALFAERALALLDGGGPGGGRWAFVLPRPVLGNESFAALRALLLGAGLDDALDAGAPFAAAVEAVVLSGGGAGTGRIACRGPNGSLPALEVAAVRALPGMPLPLGALPAELLARSAAALAGTAVGELVEIRRGVEAGKRSAGVVPAGTAGSVPLRAGEEVFAHRIAAARRALVPGVLRPAHAKPALFRGPKLLVRRVASRLTAAVDLEDHAALNTLYVLRCADEGLLHALAAALNSAPLRRWHELTFVGGDRIFPYLRASQLAALPFPHRAVGALADAGRRLFQDPGAVTGVDAIVAAALC